jgi:exosortase A
MIAEMTTPRVQPVSWKLALALSLLLLALTVGLYWDTATSIVLTWLRSETFTHGFLVPPISAWLIWRQRENLGRLSPTPNFWALLALAGAALAWLLGDLAAVNALAQLSFVAMLVLTVPALLGLAVTRAVIFPLGFLFFAVPIGEFAMPQLMEWTADFTVQALRLSGIPVYREGLQFVIPSGNWSVVEACSGVRYLIASVTVGTLFAYLNYQSTKRRVLFVIVSFLVPVLANWLRAYIIVMLGHFSGNKLATGVDHLVYGWLFFGIVIMLMFMIGARWAEPPLETGRSSDSYFSAPNASSTARLWANALCFAALVGLPHLALWKIENGQVRVSKPLVEPQALSADWQRVPKADLSFKPAFQNPSSEINTIFSSGGKQVGLYLAHYHHQDYNRKLVSSANSLVGSKDPLWVVVRGAKHAVDLDGSQKSLQTTELRALVSAGLSNEIRLEVWQIYWINGTLTASDYLAKVYSAVYRLLGRGDDSAVIVVYAVKGPPGVAQATLQDFLATNYRQINAILSAPQQPK